jgi:hypothetical protein
VGAHIMRMMSLIISFLAGMVLGQGFKVLVLVPASIIAVAATIGIGVAQASDVWAIVLMALAVMTMLQIGYLIGAGVRSFMVAARAARRYGRPAPISRAIRRAAH